MISKEELESIVEEVLEQIEDQELAENLDITTRYMPEEEAPAPAPNFW